MFLWLLEIFWRILSLKVPYKPSGKSAFGVFLYLEKIGEKVRF